MATKVKDWLPIISIIVGVLGVIMIGCSIVWAARTASIDTQHSLDVHAADQGRRITNIEQGVARNEKALQRIEDRLDELLSQ